MAFGRELAACRRLAGLSQAALAIESGMTRRHLLRLELGQRRTRATTIRRLAEAIAGAAAPSFWWDADYIEEALLARLAEYGQGPAPESRYAGHEERLARLAERREEKLLLAPHVLRQFRAEIEARAREIAGDRALRQVLTRRAWEDRQRAHGAGSPGRGNDVIEPGKRRRKGG